MSKKSRLYDFDKTELQNTLDLSSGYVDALRRFGIGGSSSIKTLKNIIKEYNLSIDNMEKNRLNAIDKGRRTNNIPLSEILVKDSNYKNISRLKIRIFSEGLKSNKCDICGIEKWMDRDITMQLHHINGVNNDHRLENIQILCPNCHSQTENFCGANNK